MSSTWNREQEIYLKNLGEQSIAYTWMQEKTAEFYTKIDRYLGIIIIILSGVIGTNNFVDTEITTRDVIFGILSYLVTILGMLNQFLKPMEVSQQRINIGNKFQDIYYDIKQQLAKPKEERKSAEEYLETITEKFIELYDFSPQINGFIVSKFKSTFKNSNITMPLNTDFIDEIKIFNEDKQNISINIDKNIEIELDENKKDKRKRKPSPNALHEFIMERLKST